MGDVIAEKNNLFIQNMLMKKLCGKECMDIDKLNM